MAKKLVPRLSSHYEDWALYWFDRGMDHSMWFYLMAAWCYEDEDNELGLAPEKETKNESSKNRSIR